MNSSSGISPDDEPRCLALEVPELMLQDRDHPARDILDDLRVLQRADAGRLLDLLHGLIHETWAPSDIGDGPST